MLRRFAFSLLACTVLGVLMPAPAHAQVPLSQLLVNLIQSEVRLGPPPQGFVSHEAHFVPGLDQQIAPFFFNQQLVTQLATFPTGSSSGGFTYTFDPALGTFSRATDSFGPMFAERALTNGRGKVTIGTNFQYSKYSSFEGQDLSGGAIKFFLRHSAAGGQFFEGDLIETALDLDLSSATTTFFVNYGMTDRWDVAVSVPVVRVSMDANVQATVLRLATGNLNVHAFPGGGTTASFGESGSASGVGDLVVRTKYRLTPAGGRGLAAAVDVRLPTGASEDLLGAGAAAFTATLIGSSSRGRFAPHFNVSFGAAGSGDFVDTPNEFGYRVGTEYTASPTATLAVDLIGRTLLDVGRLTLDDVIWNFTDSNGVGRSALLTEYVFTEGSLNLFNAAFGGKFNVARNLLINASVLVALNSRGVTARFTPVVGFDYAF